MRLQWFTVALAAAHVTSVATNSIGEACLSESTDEVCGHTSLLQTSVQITKSEPVELQTRPGHQRAKGHTLASLATLTSAHGSRSDAQSHTAFFLANAFMVVAIVVLIYWLYQG